MPPAKPVPVQTSLRGMVDGVEVDGDRLMLSVGGTLVPADALIRDPPAARRASDALKTIPRRRTDGQRGQQGRAFG